MKIEDLDDLTKDQLIEQKGLGMSNQEITNKLNAEVTGSDFSVKQVSDFLKKKQTDAIKTLQKDGSFEKKMAEKYFNSMDQLNELNRQVWQEFYKMKTDPIYKEQTVTCSCGKKHTVRFKSGTEIVKISDHILKQIQHVDALLGKIRNGALNITYNYVDIAQNIQKIVPDILRRYERTGVIKILKKRELEKKKKEEDTEEEITA